MKRITVVLLALMMVLALVPTVALAVGETVAINTSQDLADAIENQADGQTWILAANTTFDLTPAMVAQYDSIRINGAPHGHVLPLTVDDLTITGGPGTVVTSSYVAMTGNWYEQNFITISGDDVTLDGLTLIPNLSQYEISDGNPSGANKIIEVLGKGSVIKNLRTQPRGGADFSGSIYYNNTDSTDTLENVYLSKGRVTLAGKVNGTLIMNNVTIDFTDALACAPNFLGFQSRAGVTFQTSNVTLLMDEHRMSLFSSMVNKPNFGETEVTAAVDPVYMIVIPAAVNFGTLQKGLGDMSQEFDVKAQDVVIEAGKSIVVSVASDFTMAGAGGALLGYQLFNGGVDHLTTGSMFATFNDGSDWVDGVSIKQGSAVVNTNLIQNAGSYQDTMTFTIAYQ